MNEIQDTIVVVKDDIQRIVNDYLLAHDLVAISMLEYKELLKAKQVLDSQNMSTK